jgi:DnaK suppressor protein
MTTDPLDPDAIEKMREKLELRKRDLLSQIEGVGDATRPVELDQQSVGRVSRVDAIQQQQMAIANRQQAAALLRSIELALQRIDDGSYGSCFECGEAIAEARLQAQPWAGLCIDCQSAREAGG